MLVKLRRKFVIITMLMVGLVLLAVFIASIMSAYQTSYESVESALIQATEKGTSEGRFPQVGGKFERDTMPPPTESLNPEDDMKPPSGTQRGESGRIGAFVPTYSVTVSSDLSIVSKGDNFTQMDDDLVTYAISEVMSADDAEGRLSEVGLYFRKAEVAEGYRIAFADASIVSDAVLDTVKVSLLIGAGALIALFIISMLLSKIAMRPIEESWNKQKRFVADASHELKTPLTVLLANNDILLSHPEKTVAEQTKWIESSQAEAQRMESLVHDLLLLAQIEQDETEQKSFLKTRSEKVDVSELANKSVLQFEALAFERSLDLESQIEPDVFIEGEPEQIERLLKILLDNACKYAEPGGHVNLAVSTEKDKATITVSNTGADISDGDLEHVFERFYRSDKARSRSTTDSGEETTSHNGSFGLGLSIAKGIVEVHGGTISVTSELGTTTFTVSGLI